MKPKFPRVASCPLAAAITMAVAPLLQAANYYWDTNGTTSGLGDTAGTWSSTGPNLMAGVPNTAIAGTASIVNGTTVTASGDSIQFGTNSLSLGSAASTIGTSGTLNINTIVFGAAQTNNVTLSAGGTITLGGTAPTIAVNTTSANATIAATLAGTAGMVKSGAGTLILTGTNTFTGGVTINGGGTLQIGNGTSGSLTSQALTFNNGGGVFNVQSLGTGSAQAMGALTFSATGAGEGTVQSTYGTSGNAALTFSSLAARGAGATGNFIVSGGSNGTTNKIVLTGVASNAFIDKGLFFGGSSYAYNDASGYVRAMNYDGVDTNTAVSNTITADKHVQITSTPANQNSISLLSLNLSGGGVDWTQNASQTLIVPAILKSGGGAVSTISGGTSLTTASNAELVIRTDAASDLLAISTTVTGFSGGLTKTGAGTLTLSGSNGYTGTTNVNGGTLELSGGNAIADANTVNLANASGVTLKLSANETFTSLTGGGFSGGNVNVGGNTLTLSNPTGNFGGTFNGTSGGVIAKNGAGTFTLSNKNTFAGAINVNAGTLALTYGYDGTATTSPMSSGGTITFAGGTSLNLAAATNIAGGIAGGNQNVGGQLISNAINISSGTFSVKTQGNDYRYVLSGGVTGGTSGTQTLSILQGSLATGSGDRSSLLISGAIANGSGGTTALNVDFQGASTTAQQAYVALSGANTFTGNITVSNTKGLLAANYGATNANGGYLVIGGELIQVAFGSRIVNVGSGGLGYVSGSGSGSVYSYSGNISLATGTFLDYLSNASQTLSGVISGAGNMGIEGAGAGTLTLSGANTYTGNTYLNAGTLAFSSIDVAANANPLGKSANTAGSLILNGGTLKSTGTGGTTDRLFSLQTSSTVDSSGTGALVFNNTGSMGFNGGTAAKTLTLAGTNTGDNTLAAVIANNTGATSIIKSGAGKWVLSNSANSYTGATTISGGTLSVSTFANGGSNSNIGASTNAAGNLILNGGTLQYTGAAVSTDRLFSLQSSSTIDASGTGAVSFANTGSMGFNGGTAAKTLTLTGTNTGTNTIAAVIGNNTGATSVVKEGTGTWVLSNASNTYTGGTTVSAGTMIYASKTAFGTGTITMAGGTTLKKITEEANNAGLATTNNINLSGGQVTLDVDFGTAKDQWLSGVISGSGGLKVVGSLRAVTLTGNNTFTGGVLLDTASNPWIQLGNANALGTGTLTINATGGNQDRGLGASTALTAGSGISNNIVINSGATFNLGGGIGNMRLSGVISGAGSLNKSDTAAITVYLDGANTYTGTTRITTGTLEVSGSIASSSAITNNASLIFNSASAQSYGNAINGSGALTKQGTGTLTLAGPNTYTGVTTVSGGTLQVQGSIASSSAITNNASLIFDSASTQSYGNVISGSGSLTKEGSGILTLSGASSYTGATDVNAGTLIVNGSISTSVLTTVKSGATLGGSGTVGDLTIDAGGFFSPGNSPGITTVDGDYIQGGTLVSEITGLTAGSQHDQVVVNGSVTLNGSLNISSFTGFTPMNGDLIFILLNDSNDAISGTFTGLAQGAVVGNYLGFDWQISYTGNSGGNNFTGGNDVVLMAIPEPRAALLGGLGLLMLLRRRRN